MTYHYSDCGAERKGGASVEYIDMIDQIVAAEHNAKTLVEESRQRQEELSAGVEQEIARLREDYLQRAGHRIEVVKQLEQASAEEAIARLDEKQRQAMERVEAVYEKNRDRWADTLFTMIAGTRP